MNAYVGTLSSVLNVQPQWSVRELLEMNDRLDIYAVDNALSHCKTVDGNRRPNPCCRDVGLSIADVVRFIECARQLAEVVVLDVPSTLDDCQMLTLDVCDEVVLIGENHPFTSAHVGSFTTGHSKPSPKDCHQSV